HLLLAVELRQSLAAHVKVHLFYLFRFVNVLAIASFFSDISGETLYLYFLQYDSLNRGEFLWYLHTNRRIMDIIYRYYLCRYRFEWPPRFYKNTHDKENWFQLVKADPFP